MKCYIKKCLEDQKDRMKMDGFYFVVNSSNLYMDKSGRFWNSAIPFPFDCLTADQIANDEDSAYYKTVKQAREAIKAAGHQAVRNPSEDY